MTSQTAAAGSDAMEPKLSDRFEEVAKLTGFYLAERDRADRLQRLLDGAELVRNTTAKELTEQRNLAASRNNAIRASAARVIGTIIADQLGFTEDQRPTRADLPQLAQRLLAMGFFDKEWYLKRHPDVSKARMDAAVHYVGWGMFEGREPCALD